MQNPYELLYLYRQGNEQALQELLNMYVPMIHNIIQQLIAKMKRLELYEEDMVQEGMIALNKAVSGYRDDQSCSFSTFAYLVIHRNLCSFLRKCSKKNYLQAHNAISLGSFLAESGSVYDFIESKDVFSDPEYVFYYNEAFERLQRKLNSLSSKDHEVLLAWMDGKSYKEASNELEITYKAYDNRLQRIKKDIYACVYENTDN